MTTTTTTTTTPTAAAVASSTAAARATRTPGRTRPVRTLSARRLALTVRSPRALLVPLLAPALFAVVVAPALATSTARPADYTRQLTYFALATAGLLIPLNCVFSGLGVVLDRLHGAMNELLVAPIRRWTIVAGNLLAAMAVTALQLVVLIGLSAARGADYDLSPRLVWFALGAVLLTVTMYGVAEILATRLTSPEEYTGALPAVAIVPFFFAGSLFPITALPAWLTAVAKVLPLTHALALFRYGLTPHGAAALHDIWGMQNATVMAGLSLAVLAGFAIVASAGAVRLFTRAGRS